MWEKNKICKFFWKQGGTEQYSGFTLGSFVKTISKVLLVSRSLPIFLKKIVKFNMQYITAMKCITTHKKIRKIGGYFRKTWHFSHYVPILPLIPPSNFKNYLPMKFMSWATFKQKEIYKFAWIKDFVMTFKRSVRKSAKRNSCFHGLSWQQCKQCKHNIDRKAFLRDHQMHMCPLSKFHFNWSCRSGVRWGGGGSLTPPLGSRFG